MGTTRDSKTAARTSAAAKPAKKKTTVRKTTAKAAAAAKPAKKKTATRKAAAADPKPAVRRLAVPKAAAPKAAAPKAATPKAATPKAVAAKTPTANAEAPKRSASRTPTPVAEAPARARRKAAEAPAPVAAPSAIPAPPERDAREERRARLEERLAQRSAVLREQQQQRYQSVAPPPQRTGPPAEARSQRPVQAAIPFSPAPAPSPAPRPDLPFDPKSFTSQAVPRPAAVPQVAPDAAESREGSLEEGGGKRRRRRRRRRRGSADGAPEGVAAPQALPPRPPPAPLPPQAPRPERAEDISQDGEPGEGGRRRRRRRRRRKGGAEAGADVQPAPQHAARRPDAAPRAQHAPAPAPSAWSGGDDDFDGRRGGRRRRRSKGGRDFSGPLPWDSAREAPAVNILPDRDPFSELVSIDPEERIDLETDTEEISMRVVDLVTPIGKGQRALIVAPPKTGKTTLLMQLARAVTENHPEVELVVMLVDERPEEVTAFRRAGYGEVLASSNDEPTHRHLKLTQHVLDIAKRRVLEGKDVCILLDSITRMARAHNVASSGHKTLSGGLDSRALERPKRFFGAARKIAGGGSLTILATALIDTGSRMDEVIFQEFKGTGNSELQLDRRLAERRIWPAIDIQKSGTRKEEKLFERDEYEGVIALRRALSGKPPAEAMQLLLARLAQYRTNREFLLDVARKAATAL